MTRLIPTLLCAVALLIIGQAQAASNGPQTIRFYKVNKQQQADRLRFTGKKARQPGCHNLVKRSRVKKAVQIGYAQCQLFTEKNCAADSLVKVSRDDKAEQIKDAEEEYQVILTDIIKNREARDREKERLKREEAEEELRLEAELEAEEEQHGEEPANETEELDDAENSDPDADQNNEGEELAESNEEDEEQEEPEPIDYEAVEADLVKRLETVPTREQIIAATPESITDTLSEGFAWYPESDNLRGVKIRSWSCSVE